MMSMQYVTTTMEDLIVNVSLDMREMASFVRVSDKFIADSGLMCMCRK